MTILDAHATHPREGGPSHSMRSRVERALWTLVWYGLGIWTPVPFHAWRRMLARLFGADVAPSARIYPGVKIWQPHNLAMKARSCLGPRVNCYSVARITLDEYALVSQYAYLCTGTHDIDDPDFQLVARPIYVGRNAWVATEAFVGPGVSVNTGAVLGARAVAMKDLAPWTVYAGNPATPRRKRTPF